MKNTTLTSITRGAIILLIPLLTVAFVVKCNEKAKPKPNDSMEIDEYLEIYKLSTHLCQEGKQ